MSKHFDVLRKHGGESIPNLCAEKVSSKYGDFWAALLELHAIADEACAGLGILEESRFKESEPSWDHDPLFSEAYLRMGELAREKKAATLCSIIPAHFGSVLPKMHTPQSGLTIRSLSHYIAYLRPSEVEVRFTRTLTRKVEHALNLLFIPWPERIVPRDFHLVECERQNMAEKYGSFTYEPKDSATKRKPADELADYLAAALKIVDRIDGVVLPELALPEADLELFVKTIGGRQPNAFFVGGVGKPGAPRDFGKNCAVFAMPFSGSGSSATSIGQREDQQKHHRWMLERKQIDQYGLGSSLDPSGCWWEHIPLATRTLSFISVSERVTLTMLICEDLARQDPIADLIRAVGPNLVIALLMDGPQLSGRWPAHYASVLADDPGSSVLTVTSIGMAELSRPKEHPEISRVVGLWRDRLQGIREIPLPKDASALVLTLAQVDEKEFTADGRSDDGQSTYLTLNGIHPLYTSKASSTQQVGQSAPLHSG